jgi:hypothetical protein
MDLLLAIFHLFRDRGRKPLTLLSRSGIRLQARDGTGEKLRFTLYLPQEQVKDRGETGSAGLPPPPGSPLERSRAPGALDNLVR